MRVRAIFAALCLLALLVFTSGGRAATAGAAGPATIGVDHSTPSGHNFEYVDFFPRDHIRLHSGDTVQFAWASNPDGLHTATLLKEGESPEQAWQSVHPAIEPDTSDAAGTLRFSQFATFPSFPPPGSGAPGACGDVTTACPYDGSADVNSGANATDGTTTFTVRLDVPAGRTLFFVCLVHQGMHGSISVVDDRDRGSSAEQLAKRAASQARSDTVGAFAAEEDATDRARSDDNQNDAGQKARESAVTASNNAPAIAFSNERDDGRPVNNEGEKSVTLIAGTATDHVEVAEMLPRDVHVERGTKVHWLTLTRVDPHTVTFPDGATEGEPFPLLCEGASGDTPSPPGPPCGGDFSKFEIGYEPAAAGPTDITTPSTFATSGVISTLAIWHPLGTTTAFSFPNTGTFTYQCKVHDHMVGTVVVED